MTNKSMVAGILSIISGAFGVLGLGWAFFAVFMVNSMFKSTMFPAYPREFMLIMIIMYVVIGVFLALLGALAIAGGIFALKRKRWVIALAGAIAGTITFFPCGIPAIILISMAKHDEFSTSKPPEPANNSIT